MSKLMLAGLLAISSLAYAGTGTPKAPKGKAKPATTCTPAHCTKPCK